MFVVQFTLLAALLTGCSDDTQPNIDGEAGVSSFYIDNRLDVDLDVTFTAGPIAAPEQLLTVVPAGETLEVFTSQGCFGCYDEPSDVLATLVLTDVATGDEVRFDPVDGTDWDFEQVGNYDVDWTLVIEAPAE
jgi:hypothetical protein